MKLSKITFLLVLVALLSSCIRKEPLNTECDIVACTLPGDVLNRSAQIYNDRVVLIVKGDVSLKNLAPEFEITPGATIVPPSGTHLNFVVPQEYTVTSQDGEWHKTYTVEIRRDNEINLDYKFQNVRQVKAVGGLCSYDVFFEVNSAGQEDWAWASANPAFALTLQGSTPSTFPTYQGEGIDGGKCVTLVTRSTGSFGQSAKKPMAAGNLFIGKFDMTNAMSHPLEATQFGTPFTRVPVSLSGTYRYTPGDVYTQANSAGKLEEVPGKTDEFNIYAVFFETMPGREWLDGTNVLAADNDQIIATAVIPDKGAKSDWTEFSIPFEFRPGKTVDPEKLQRGVYNITVVMSSSIDGDLFSGAIGSKLEVNDITLMCQDKQ